MPAIHIRQRFHAPIDKTFAVVTRHRMMADNLPLLNIEVVRHCDGQAEGLDSVRAMGIGLFKPLKEKVVIYEPPYRLEYKVVGVVAKLIKRHHGILEFSQSGDDTLVDWHIHLESSPRMLNKLVLSALDRSIRLALAKQAKRTRG